MFHKRKCIKRMKIIRINFSKFWPSFLAAGCVLQQSPQGAEGEVPEEPWLLAAGQPAVHPSGQPGAPGVLLGNAVWTPSGLGRRVSAGIWFHLYISCITVCSCIQFFFSVIVLFSSHLLVWIWRKWKISHPLESAVLSQCWVLSRTPCMRTLWHTTSCACCCNSSMPALSWQTSC